MIISYEHKFIFWKPPKTAGTSIQCALGVLCSGNDIVTPITPTPQTEGYDIIYTPRNYKRQNKILRSHMAPAGIRNNIEQDIWDNFFKITIVRNPWDLCVSDMWWQTHLYNKKNKTQKSAPKKISARFCGGKYDNYYFYPKNVQKTFADFHIRYENINEDFKKVCEKIDVPYVRPPRLKSTIRKEKRKYTTYYDDRIKNLVARNYKNIIDYFGYKFGD